MKYLIRSIKYFLWFAVIFCIIIAILVLTTDGVQITEVFDPEKGLFKANSLWKITAFFIAIAAVYPSFGFVKKETYINGNFEQRRNTIIEVFENARFMVWAEDEETITFRQKSAVNRFTRMYEDQVVVTKDESPIYLSGFRKDVYRLSNSIEYRIKVLDEENQ